MKKIQKTLITIAAIALLLPSVLTVCLANDLGGFIPRCIYMLTVLAFYTWLLCVMPTRYFIRRTLWIPIVSIISLSHILVWRTTPTQMWIYTLFFVSEPDEILFTLKSSWWMILLFCLTFGGYIYLMERHLDKVWIVSKRYRTILRRSASVWLLLAAIGCFVAETSGKMYAFHAVRQIGPIADVYYTFDNLRQLHAERIAMEIVDHTDYACTTTAEDDEMVVVILGESSRYRNWQINGYERETNPRLMKRKDQIITMDSCYAVANLTVQAVPMIVSAATPPSLDYYSHPAFSASYQTAGFSTVWITSQSFRNQYLTHLCDQCNVGVKHKHKNGKYDIDLTTELKKYLPTIAGKQLIVLHGKGSHHDYLERYPEQQAFFLPDRSKSIIRSREILVNAYDNTLRMTDYFVDSVINIIEQTGRPAILLYVSDHGENLMDNGSYRMLHGQESSSIYEYHVPMFYWASEAYKERYPERWQQLEDNRHKRNSTSDVYHTLLHLGGVTSSRLNLQHALSSPEFVPDTVSYRIDPNWKYRLLDITEP